MPHKINPKRVVSVIAMSGALRGCAAPAMEGGRPSHEGDAVANRLVAEMLDRACPLAWQLAKGLEDLTARALPQPDRMAENLARTGALLATEHLMMLLAPHMGRAAAHDAVHHALEQARDAGEDVQASLCATAAVRKHLGADDIARALDPAQYLGDSAAIALAGAELGRRLAEELRGEAG